MKRPPVLLALLAVASATCALAQNPSPSPDDETAPSAASSPHQRDATSTSAAEAPTPSSQPSTPATPHQREVTDGSKAKTMKAVTPQSFASQAAIIGKAEIELGQIAMKNTQDEGVRKYAERMVKDHSAADKKLKAIATKENLQLPQSLDAEHQSLKTKLQGLKGADFDREYINAMAKGHDKAVALFESVSQQAQMSGELKQFAASTLPTLEEHKEMAHSLHQK
jgi:putative membrane protein